jgi:outer membrane biosynthesis protein TonB
MRRLLQVTALIVLVPLLAACASASAKTKPVEMPPMSVPPPPPRVIEPTPRPEPTPEPVADWPPAPTAKPSRPARETREPAKPEAKPPEAQEAPQQPAPVPQPPPTQLRTPATANDTEAENAIRGSIDRGRNLLASVNFPMLSNERKKAYNDAKMFLDQAEAALKQGNYVFAQGVANKGELLPHDLAGR